MILAQHQRSEVWIKLTSWGGKAQSIRLDRYELCVSSSHSSLSASSNIGFRPFGSSIPRYPCSYAGTSSRLRPTVLSRARGTGPCRTVVTVVLYPFRPCKHASGRFQNISFAQTSAGLCFVQSDGEDFVFHSHKHVH